MHHNGMSRSSRSERPRDYAGKLIRSPSGHPVYHCGLWDRVGILPTTSIYRSIPGGLGFRSLAKTRLLGPLGGRHGYRCGFGPNYNRPHGLDPTDPRNVTSQGDRTVRTSRRSRHWRSPRAPADLPAGPTGETRAGDRSTRTLLVVGDTQRERAFLRRQGEPFPAVPLARHGRSMEAELTISRELTMG